MAVEGVSPVRPKVEGYEFGPPDPERRKRGPLDRHNEVNVRMAPVALIVMWATTDSYWEGGRGTITNGFKANVQPSLVTRASGEGGGVWAWAATERRAKDAPTTAEATETGLVFMLTTLAGPVRAGQARVAGARGHQRTRRLQADGREYSYRLQGAARAGAQVNPLAAELDDQQQPGRDRCLWRTGGCASGEAGQPRGRSALIGRSSTGRCRRRVVLLVRSGGDGTGVGPAFAW